MNQISGFRLSRAAVLLMLLCAPAALRAEENPCLDCHSDQSLANGAGKSLYVKAETFDASAHGKSGIGCTACHADLDGVREFPHAEKLAKPDCSACHGAEAADHASSVHGEAIVRVPEAFKPTCTHCHGAHGILPSSDPLSRTNRLNIVATCSDCHAKLQIARHPQKSGKQIIQSYAMSVHGLALSRSGLSVTAVCSDCHTAHRTKPGDDPQSPVQRKNIPETCGKCHSGVSAAFYRGIHGRDFKNGNSDVPVCTDCHGEHGIKSHYDSEATIYTLNVAMMCSKCHEDQGLSKKYNLPPERLGSFSSTYHGVAGKLGDIAVANCESCHGNHDILASSDPASPTNPANLQATCGKCHPGKDLHLTGAKIHVTKAGEIHWIADLIRKFYITMIISMLGGFLAYILIDLLWRWRTKIAGRGIRQEKS